MGLKLPSMQTYGSVNKMIDKLYATNNYKFINYDIVQENNSSYLKLYVTEDESRHFLKFGSIMTKFSRPDCCSIIQQSGCYLETPICL
jgi:hypothetical protein